MQYSVHRADSGRDMEECSTVCRELIQDRDMEECSTVCRELIQAGIWRNAVPCAES